MDGWGTGIQILLLLLRTNDPARHIHRIQNRRHACACMRPLIDRAGIRRHRTPASPARSQRFYGKCLFYVCVYEVRAGNGVIFNRRRAFNLWQAVHQAGRHIRTLVLIYHSL